MISGIIFTVYITQSGEVHWRSAVAFSKYVLLSDVYVSQDSNARLRRIKLRQVQILRDLQQL